MAFWMAGVPGSPDMVKVNEPSAIEAGMSRFGICPALNSSTAIGYTLNATTNRETPP